MDFLTFLAKLSQEQDPVQNGPTLPKPTIAPVSPEYFINNRFLGKTMLITGAARGIGRATAIRASKEGANVVVADWLQSEGQATVTAIKELGGSADFVYADVSNTSDCDRMVKHSVNKFGSLDLAVNNAGVVDGLYSGDNFDYDAQRSLLPNVIHQASDDYWSNVLKVNVDGTFKSMRAELRQMVKQSRSGAIVNVGSVAGLTGVPGNPAYTASKHAVNGLTRNAAIDYASFAIRVNSVNMASTATPMAEKTYQFLDALRNDDRTHGMIDPVKTQSVLKKANPSHPDSTVWEQASVILFLLSDEASNLTGGNFSTDGGWTAF